MFRVEIPAYFRYTGDNAGEGRAAMEPQVVLGLIAGCAALVGVLAFLSLHILRREPQYLRERSKRGEILLLTFEQVMALYNAAPEKWGYAGGRAPVYFPQGKGKDGLLVYLLPKERKRYRRWFDWRLSHGEGRRAVSNDCQGPALYAGGPGGPFAKPARGEPKSPPGIYGGTRSASSTGSKRKQSASPKTYEVSFSLAPTT